MELIEDYLKALQEAVPGASIDTSLTPIENLRLLLDSFKEYSSGLNEKTRQEIEENLVEKRLLA